MSKPIASIKKMITSHNLWSSTAGFSGKRVSFAYADLAGLTLEDYNLSHADFQHSNLKNVTFKNCKLNGCRFDYSTLENTKFIGCSIGQTSFEEANIASCQFPETDIGDSERLLDSLTDFSAFPSLKVGKLYRLSKFLNGDVRRNARKTKELSEQEVYYAVCLEVNDEGVDILVEDVIIRNVPKWTMICGFHDP